MDSLPLYEISLHSHNTPSHYRPANLCGSPQAGPPMPATDHAPNPFTGGNAARLCTGTYTFTLSNCLINSDQHFVTFPTRLQRCLQILKNTSSHCWRGLMIYFKEKWVRVCGSVLNVKRDLEMKSQLA